ncbi:unannotated protein [freshwater metagenome]|uniref:Unannotated protein n=1 Tax=freshwater metagenome TaxID=449393 RepID=A0A6J7E391_9ZZZZ
MTTIDGTSPTGMASITPKALSTNARRPLSDDSVPGFAPMATSTSRSSLPSVALRARPMATMSSVMTSTPSAIAASMVPLVMAGWKYE